MDNYRDVCNVGDVYLELGKEMEGCNNTDANDADEAEDRLQEEQQHASDWREDQ